MRYLHTLDARQVNELLSSVQNRTEEDEKNIRRANAHTKYAAPPVTRKTEHA